MPSVGAMPNLRALRNVREQRGLQIADVAEFAAIPADRLADFEQGEREPTRKQIERLAAAYGVPLYSLFGEAIPNLPPLPQDYRKPVPGPATLSARGVRTLLASERISEFTKQLSVQLDYAPADFAPGAKSARTPLKRARELRAAFDEWLAPRQANFAFTGTDEQRFMGALRLFYEIQGGVLNVNDAPPDDYMGFFVEPDAGLPTIFVNRAVSSKKAQLFTLAHEYSHALMDEDGISNPFMPRNAIERACNVFAAEFLAPMRQFSGVAEAIPQGTRSDIAAFVTAASTRTLLSKHAAAIRLVEGDYITQAQFRSWRALFTSNRREEKDEEREAATGGAGGVPHAKRLSELGHLPVALAKRAVDEGIVDGFEVAESLGLSQSLQERAFALASRRFQVALT